MNDDRRGHDRHDGDRRRETWQRVPGLGFAVAVLITLALLGLLVTALS